jgi:hypothetical protein
MELKIEKKTARRLFPESPEWFREVLTETFGKDCFAKRKFEDIKTFEDACEELGIVNNSCRPIFDDEEDPDEIAYKKLKVIIKAINQGWVPDWTDGNQRKWYPWFNLSSGFGFSVSDCDYVGTVTCVGSRLCFETEAKSNYCAKQFIDLYEQFLTIKK